MLFTHRAVTEPHLAKVGVLGGSFNPVHLGHLHIAHRVRELFSLSKVVFVVAGAPPHKPPHDLISFNHRYAMVSLATSGSTYFLPSQIELETPASPYSIDTLAKLAAQFALRGSMLYFIAGGDSFLEVAGWHRGEELLNSHNFVFVMRPGFHAPEAKAVLPRAAAAHVLDFRGLDFAQVQRRLECLSNPSDCRIFLVDLNAPEIAASQIRLRASMRQPLEGFVPAPVCEYIQKLNLYGD